MNRLGAGYISSHDTGQRRFSKQLDLNEWIDVKTTVACNISFLYVFVCYSISSFTLCHEPRSSSCEFKVVHDLALHQILDCYLFRCREQRIQLEVFGFHHSPIFITLIRNNNVYGIWQYKALDIKMLFHRKKHLRGKIMDRARINYKKMNKSIISTTNASPLHKTYTPIVL